MITDDSPQNDHANSSGNALAHINRGLSHQAENNLQAALAEYRYALDLQPDLAEGHYHLGNALHQLKQLDAAQASYQQAILLKPDYAEAWYKLGLLAITCKQYQQALSYLDKCLSLNAKHAEAFCCRGMALFSLHHYAEALGNVDRALALQADYAAAWNLRGVILQNRQQPESAVSCYERAIALKADYLEAHCNLALVQNELKQHQDAVRSFNRALSLKPDCDYLPGYRLHCKMQVCDWQDWALERDAIVAAIRNGQKAATPFTVLMLQDDPALQASAASIWVAAKFNLPQTLPPLTAYCGHQRIRVAYFSADFCQHPLAVQSARLYELHNRQRFEVFGFSATPQPDATTHRVQIAVEHFIDIRQMADHEVAALVRSLEIDIAIDLGGHTSHSRSALFASRIAPLQVGYLGYPGTLGSDCLDYLLADSTLIPPHSQPFYSETIACLPHSYMVNDNTRPISDPIFYRRDFDLPESGFVFCCFNNAYKLNPDMFACWMRILQEVADSVLWLSVENPTAIANLRREAEQRGIAAERLVFAKRLPLAEKHLARLQLADLFLDTLPYNAHATASDALWAGLPVLTCAGKSFAGRVAASLLSAIELPELITHTLQDYQALAIALAGQPQKLATIKARLAQNRLTTPLFDSARFTLDMEALYSQIHEQQLAGFPPAPIYPLSYTARQSSPS